MSSRRTGDGSANSVNVRLYPQFVEGTAATDVSVPCGPRGVTVRELLETMRQRGDLEIPGVAGRTDESAWSHVIVLSETRVLGLEDVVRPGDRVSVLPPISGG